MKPSTSLMIGMAPSLILRVSSSAMPVFALPWRMAAYMESSFTGEAARDRYYCDHSSHTLITGGASSRIPRALILRHPAQLHHQEQNDLSQTVCGQLRHKERVRCCSGNAVDLRPPVPIRRDKLTPARDCLAFCRIGSSE